MVEKRASVWLSEADAETLKYSCCLVEKATIAADLVQTAAARVNLRAGTLVRCERCV